MIPGDRSNQCPQGFTLVSAGPYCAGKATLFPIYCESVNFLLFNKQFNFTKCLIKT